jgi:cytochrome c-type biogenesis protein
MDVLYQLLDNTSLPIATAFILGLLTAISPCPMATNITAIGFISKDVENKNRVFFSGLYYTLGRVISYTLLAFIIYLGADQFKVSAFFQMHGDKILGPLLLFIGLFMLGLINIRFPGLGGLTSRMEKKETKNYWDVILLGMVFALAFCPYSGVLYFAMLIPMTITSISGMYLPVVYAIATGIPVIIFAYLLAYTVSGVGKMYNRLKTFEYWFRRILGVVFIGVGLYYLYVAYILRMLLA